MNTTVWKYPLSNHEMTFEIPVGAQFLCIMSDPWDMAYPALYFLIDEKAETEARTFCGCYTGIRIESTKRYYLGSIVNNNKLAMHVFEML